MTVMKFLWPFPTKMTAKEREQYAEEDKNALQRIVNLRCSPDAELADYLEAAQRIVDYEDNRKVGAETRATAYIAAIATLIPLMTWALGSTTPFCSGSGACGAWSAAFDVAVIYFAFAAYWCLKTLSVANYHTIGVEDLVDIKERKLSLGKELVVQTMYQARANRETINQKLDFIKTAQRCFFMGLMVLSVLLALDPWFRLGTQASGTVISTKEMASNSAAKQQMAASSSVSKPRVPASISISEDTSAGLPISGTASASAAASK